MKTGFLRTGHGQGAGQPHIENPMKDLPTGVQAPEQAPSKGERRRDGTFTKGARTAQSEGGKSRRETTRLARRLGLSTVPDCAEFAPYKKAAVDFRRSHCSSIARSVGGGFCGPGPSSIVATASLQLAASRFLFDLAGRKPSLKLFAEASRLANDSRQNLLAAHSLCALESRARVERPDPALLPPGYEWTDDSKEKP
jgi:hypothetical protein